MQATTREFVDPVYGFDSEFVGYSLAAVAMNRSEVDDARSIVEAALAPADPSFVRIELARLRASTKARTESTADLAMILQVLAEECATYPADVVQHALRQWARREVWFPSLAELRDELQRRSKRRRALRECLGYA